MINEYPYIDFHELNLDWVIRQIKQMHQDWSDFRAANEITNAGLWDITKQYASWTIVSDNNKGYISLQPVPAGVDINNTAYWGLIADYSMFITNLTSRVIALENGMNAVNERLSAIRSHNIVLFSDSWSHAGGLHEWVTTFRQTTGYMVHNYARSGASYAETSTNGNTNLISMQVDAAQTEVNNNVYDPNEIDIVLFLAGVNDALYSVESSHTVYAQAAIDCANRCKILYPNARIVFLLNGGIGALPTTLLTDMRNWTTIMTKLLGRYFTTYTTRTWFQYSDYDGSKFHVTANNERLKNNILRVCEGYAPSMHVSYTVGFSGGSAHVDIDQDTSVMVLRYSQAAVNGAVTISVPGCVIFDNYDAVWAYGIDVGTGDYKWFPVTPSYSNDEFTFTVPSNETVRFNIPFYV